MIEHAEDSEHTESAGNSTGHSGGRPADPARTGPWGGVEAERDCRPAGVREGAAAALGGTAHPALGPGRLAAALEPGRSGAGRPALDPMTSMDQEPRQVPVTCPGVRKESPAGRMASWASCAESFLDVYTRLACGTDSGP